jgi:hypothetical protein
MEPKERRSSTRQPIKLAAQLDIGAGNPLPCQIADFCAEGMYIRYSAETSGKIERAFSGDAPQELVVRFRGLEGNRRYELHVTPTRRTEGAMGVSFTRSDPEAVNAMLKLCGASREQDRSSLKAPSDRVQFVLHQAARAITHYIEPLMDACIVQVAEELQAAAKKAPHDQQANEYLEAAGQIHSRQRVIWHQMAASPNPRARPARRCRWSTRTNSRNGWRYG